MKNTLFKENPKQSTFDRNPNNEIKIEIKKIVNRLKS